MSSTLQLPYPSILRGLGVTFCVFFPHNSLMNILQKIFTDHFEEMLYIQHPRDSVIENVEKMIHCGDPSFGGAMYACPSCRNFKFVPFRCHSRFCPSCGNMYAIDRTTSMSFKIINVQHRHCVFTIARELRPLFLSDRSLLNSLFSSVNSVVSRMFHKDNKSELFTPGFICVLHTFGRDLKWNPHIHCFVSEGGVGNSLRWCHKKHFNYKLFGDIKENENFRRFNYRSAEKVYKEFMLYAIGRNIMKYHRFLHHEIEKYEGKKEQKTA